MNEDNLSAYKKIADDLVVDNRDQMIEALLGSARKRRRVRSTIRMGSSVALVLFLVGFVFVFNESSVEPTYSRIESSSSSSERKSGFVLVKTEALDRKKRIRTGDFDSVLRIDDGGLLGRFSDHSVMLATSMEDGKKRLFLFD